MKSDFQAHPKKTPGSFLEIGSGVFFIQKHRLILEYDLFYFG